MLSKRDRELLPLPEFNQRLAGETSDSKENYNISVSNADGYLCHLTATCYFRATPEDVYAIFVNPGTIHTVNDSTFIRCSPVQDMTYTPCCR